MMLPLTITQRGIGSVRLENEYRVKSPDRSKMLEDVRAYFEKTFHNTASDKETIIFQYHGRIYQIRLSTEKEATQANLHGEFATGHLCLDVRYPNSNKSNNQLINRLTRELKVPWERDPLPEG